MSMAEIHEHKSGEYTNGVLHASEVKESGEHNIVFGSLVTGDNDIVGLVAYSIYKQNKHDWLIAFEKTRGRGPNDEETQCYIIGESTPRRLSTYRHLAQATLDGLSVKEQAQEFCVVSSAGKDLGCFPTQEEANAKLQQTGQERLLEVIGTTARLEMREVIQLISPADTKYDRLDSEATRAAAFAARERHRR